jgi:hypothetical protein
MPSLLAIPAAIACVTEASTYPVADIIILLDPFVCNKLAGLEVDGVKVIFPAVTVKPDVKVTPPIVILVIAALHAGLSV